MQWRPASPGATAYPHPHKFYSLFSEANPWPMPEGIGEVFEPNQYRRGAVAVNRWWNNREPLGYDVGLEACEPPEVFQLGEVYNPLRPPQEFNEDGFPTCCLKLFRPRIGVLWGFRATPTIVPPISLPVSCGGVERFTPPFDITVSIPAGVQGWFNYNQAFNPDARYLHFVSSSDPLAEVKVYFVFCPTMAPVQATLSPGGTWDSSPLTVAPIRCSFSSRPSAYTARVRVSAT